MKFDNYHAKLYPRMNASKSPAVLGFIIFALLLSTGFRKDTVVPQTGNNNRVITGADRFSHYLPLLKGKRVGIFSNHTSVVGNTHLVDTLKSYDVTIPKIFAP